LIAGEQTTTSMRHVYPCPHREIELTFYLCINVCSHVCQGTYHPGNQWVAVNILRNTGVLGQPVQA